MHVTTKKSKIKLIDKFAPLTTLDVCLTLCSGGNTVKSMAKYFELRFNDFAATSHREIQILI